MCFPSSWKQQTWTYYLLVTKAFHSRTPQQISKAHVKTHEHCFTNFGVQFVVEDFSYTSFKQMLLFLICRFSLSRLKRFVHFNAIWLDFVIVGRKFKKNFGLETNLSQILHKYLFFNTNYHE